MTAAGSVLVVGAGPVGLLLAGELAAAGVPVTVVDRLAAPTTESRASQLSTLTAQLLAERGLDAVLAEAVPEPGGHFAGLRLDLSTVDTPWAGNWKLPQFRTEALLAERAEKLGAVVLRPYELVGLVPGPDGVECALVGPAGPVRRAADWVVGCDGAGSTVRALGGFGLDRTPATRELLRADVTGVEIPTRRFERTGRGLAVAMTRDGVTRVMVHELGRGPGPRPARYDDVVRQWKAVTGDDISAGTAVWVDAFDDERGLARRYRCGRLLLAGDAAHWHLPIGGQALNLGLQDAVALGWRLAAVAAGWGPDGLLDSYGTERRAAAAAGLESVAAQELLLLGGAEVDAVRAVLAELLQLPAAADRLARAAAGLDVDRRPGLTSGDLPVLVRPGPAGVVTLTGGGRLRLVDGPDPVLLRPDGCPVWTGGAGLDAALRTWFGGTVEPARSSRRRHDLDWTSTWHAFIGWRL